MTEFLTQTRVEEAISEANNFLQSERGAILDGDVAADTVRERVVTVAEEAEALLRERPILGKEGFYAPLSKGNPEDFARAAATLKGYMVLVPAMLTGDKVPGFYPAVVSEQDATPTSMRLHVFKQPYKRQLTSSVSTLLSASGQSETAGVGDHGHENGDGVEAEHFATILTAGGDKATREAWQEGDHINHKWRKNPRNSVTSQMSQTLFGSEIPQATITITKKGVEEGEALLLWHEGMRDQETGQIETATRPGALVVIQALGMEALKKTDPTLENVKILVSA